MTLASIAHATGVTGAVAVAVGGVLSASAWEKIASLPLGIASLAVATYAVHTAYRSSIRSSEAQERTAKAMQDLASRLSERPCIRHRDND